jgi:hypothetical protein
MDDAYGSCDSEGKVMNVLKGEGRISEILDYVVG